jgi:hypothetical protein
MTRPTAIRFAWLAASCFVPLVILTSASRAADKPQYTVLPHPSPEELAQGLARWAERFPDAIRVSSCGNSGKGRPIQVCRITDYSVPNEDKQVALFTCAHVATELNGATGLLRLARWLIGDDPRAQAIRRNQIVLIVPYTNPDGVAGDGGSNVYTCWNLDGVVDPERHPEAASLKRLMDEYRPDVHVDVHGFNFAEQKMWESTGISWASGLSRSYLHRVPQLMDEAAEAAGFLMTKGEQSAGQVLSTTPIAGAERHYYLRKAGFNISVYPYHQFHTLAFIIESGFEESIVVRLRRLLEIGGEVWRGERYAGYPTNQVGCWTSMAVSAWGTTASQRRASRVELWQKIGQLTFGCAHPEPRGSIMAFCATTREAAQQYVAPGKVDTLIEKLKDHPQFDVAALADFVQRMPAQNLLPRYLGSVGDGEAEPVKNGLVLRLLIPYNDARLTEIRLDGHTIEPSDTDGYQLRTNPGTILEVAIPPDKVKPLHIATCFYDSPTKRRAGFGPEDWE